MKSMIQTPKSKVNSKIVKSQKKKSSDLEKKKSSSKKSSKKSSVSKSNQKTLIKEKSVSLRESSIAQNKQQDSQQEKAKNLCAIDSPLIVVKDFQKSYLCDFTLNPNFDRYDKQNIKTIKQFKKILKKKSLLSIEEQNEFFVLLNKFLKSKKPSQFLKNINFMEVDKDQALSIRKLIKNHVSIKAQEELVYSEQQLKEYKFWSQGFNYPQQKPPKLYFSGEYVLMQKSNQLLQNKINALLSEISPIKVNQSIIGA